MPSVEPLLEVQETEDTGGGQNVGWIGDGDWLRFDDVDFGDVPATEFILDKLKDTKTNDEFFQSMKRK